MGEELQKTNDTALQKPGGNFVLGTLGGTATAVVFGVGGFFLLEDKYGAMGSVRLLLLPFMTGFATGLLSPDRRLMAASLAIGALICTAALMATGKEGRVCLLMSTPLIAFGLALGALFGVIVRRKLIDEAPRPSATTLMLLLVVPLF